MRSLVLEKFCKTPVTVTIYDNDINEDGSPHIVFENELKCNFNEKTERILTDNENYTEINATLLFSGDPFMTLNDISKGKVIILGIEREIVSGFKCRDEYGRVNYTQLKVK